MRFAVCLPLILLLAVAIAAPVKSHAQVSVEVEEIRRLSGQIEDLRAALEAQRRRTERLEQEVEKLRADLRQVNDRNDAKLVEFATRDALKSLASAIEEVDRKRIADVNLIKAQVEEAISKLRQGLEVVKPDGPTIAPPPPPFEGKVYPHTVAKGEYLSTILDAYNAEFKKRGKGRVTLEDVKRANPTININRIYVGQEILIPDPSAVN